MVEWGDFLKLVRLAWNDSICTPLRSRCTNMLAPILGVILLQCVPKSKSWYVWADCTWLEPHSACHRNADWRVALFWLVHVPSWEPCGKSGSLGQNDGRRSARSNCVYENCTGQPMSVVLWAPVLLICGMFIATFTLVCLLSCHGFFTSSTSLHVDACFTIAYVCYSCTNSLFFEWCIKLPCITSLFNYTFNDTTQHTHLFPGRFWFLLMLVGSFMIPLWFNDTIQLNMWLIDTIQLQGPHMRAVTSWLHNQWQV